MVNDQARTPSGAPTVSWLIRKAYFCLTLRGRATGLKDRLRSERPSLNRGSAECESIAATVEVLQMPSFTFDSARNWGILEGRTREHRGFKLRFSGSLRHRLASPEPSVKGGSHGVRVPYGPREASVLRAA